MQKKGKRKQKYVLLKLSQNLQRYGIDIHQNNCLDLNQAINQYNSKILMQPVLENSSSASAGDQPYINRLKTTHINFLSMAKGLIFYKVKPLMESKLLQYKPLEAFEYAILFGKIKTIGNVKFIIMLAQDFKFLKDQSQFPKVLESEINKIELKIPKSKTLTTVTDEKQIILVKTTKYIKRELESMRLLIDDGVQFYTYLLFLKWQIFPDNYLIYLKNQPISEWILEKLTPLISKVKIVGLRNVQHE
eukprot:EST46678.1 Hypothetical protein SS50377_13309 [Spironucleus salmonicida]